MSRIPAYVTAHKNGLLEKSAAGARAQLKSCTLCPKQCRVNRLKGELGICGTGKNAVVSSFNAHLGEESPLVGRRGSGTIFLTNCNLLCVFCQNYDISHQGCGRPVSADELADMMLSLQDAGCHNINFVTPSHVVSQILDALIIAVSKGLRVPLVYNSSGYDRVETLRLLDGIVDIYMPDFKFWHAETAKTLCNAADYPQQAMSAVQEMHRQVGDLVIDPDGTTRRGLLVRHLVLPAGLGGTREIMRFISEHISRNTYVNIMSQYRPCGEASKIPAIAAPLSAEDYQNALEAAREEGITRLDRPARRFIIW